MLHNSPLHRTIRLLITGMLKFIGFACGLRFWLNFFLRFRGCGCFFNDGLRFLIDPNAPLVEWNSTQSSTTRANIIPNWEQTLLNRRKKQSALYKRVVPFNYNEKRTYHNENSLLDCSHCLAVIFFVSIFSVPCKVIIMEMEIIMVLDH